MAFNALGDLFCTDQEGATWLPNGNPLDELLQIEPGRHYGFPPRHPKHLPEVIDEPSVFDYGPQHQSTCGLNFNEPVNGGPIFGPGWWRGDALVSGESRGKLYRTKLVKTPPGYVAQNQLIASLNMLTIDACVSPQGELVITTHSGKPDWGSGPTGVGKLYKVSYTDKEAPQPVAIWPASETETHIEFSRALDTAKIKEWTKRIVVTQGRFVAAGDAFEVMRPGYQAVQNQLLEPRYLIKVLSTALSADGKTLIIRTEPRKEAVNYAVSIPRDPQSAKGKELPQAAQTDLAWTLTGVQADWRSSAGGEKWSGWLPHLDLIAAREFTKHTSSHAPLWSAISKPGQLNLRAQLDLWEMLHATTQPGAKLGFEYPDETVTVVLKSKAPLEARAASMTVKRISETETHLTATSKKNGWFPIEVELNNAAGSELSLDVSWFTAEDSRRRALPLRRVLMPWATPEIQGDEKIAERKIPEIAGGNWLRGQKLFQSEKTSCAKCHALGGAGPKVGPDLANLIYRDYASVLKDIAEPSAAINPDHVAYNVELKGGEFLTGVLVGAEGDQSRIADATGKITAVEKTQIVSMKPSTVSLMPEGLLNALNEQERQDLLSFLLIPPPLEPAPIQAKGEPPPRSRAEINAILKNAGAASVAVQKTLRIVLCSGPKDHGPGEHDYPLWQKRWSTLLPLADNVAIETAFNWPSAEQFSKSDVIVFFSNNPGWTAVERGVELDGFLNRGGGLVYLHYAVDGHAHVKELAQRIGLAWGGAPRFRHGAVDLKFQPHPISAGFDKVHFVDESYWNLVGDRNNIQTLATGDEEGKPQPLFWTRAQGKGRVFVSILGHYNWTFDDPLFRILILRGICWTANEPVDRLAELATIGARVAE
jgi:putative heme-binding domain-containing protein